MFRKLIKVSLTLLCIVSNVGADEPAYPRSDLLVEPTVVASGESRVNFVVLDARKRVAYNSGHVPGAIWVDHDGWSKAFGDGSDAQKWSDRIGALGIDGKNPVAIYDDNFANDSARIWWILKYWGVKDVRLINGGWKTWAASGLPVSSEAPAIVGGDFRAIPAEKRLASKKNLLDSLKTGNLQIVDARSEAEHCGTDAMENKKAGAIPGARHLEWIDLIDKNTARFKPSVELRKIYDAAGIDLKRPTATHCQGGGEPLSWPSVWN